MPMGAVRVRLGRLSGKVFRYSLLVWASCNLSAQVTFSASQLVFPDTTQGASSPPQSIFVTNAGALPVMLFGPSIDAAGFSMSSDCPLASAAGAGGVFAGGAGCTIRIQFTPYAVGPQSSTLSIFVTDQAFNFLNQPSVLLSGNALKPPPSADLRASAGGGFPNPVEEGSVVTLQVGMGNQGPDPATNAVLSLAIPSGYTVISCNNASTSEPCENGTASSSLTVASLPALGQITMIAVIRVPTNIATQPGPGGPVLPPMTYIVSATSATGDLVSSNNSAIGSIAIIPPSLVALSTTAIDFGLQIEHENFAPARQITLTSLGPSPLAIDSISIQGAPFEFTESDNCPKLGAEMPMAVGSSCTISVYVFPFDDGPRSAVLSIADSAPNSPQQVSLSAFGHPLAVGPTALSFPMQTVNTSGSGAVGLDNFGSKGVKFTGANITGDFSYTDGCAPSFADLLPPGSECGLAVSFTPTAPGLRTGTLTIFDDDITSPQVIQLSGIGAAAAVSSTSLTYPIQTVGVSSSQTLTLTNVYSAPLSVGAIHASGDFSQKNDCGSLLGPKSSCNIIVTFSPTDLGPREGTLVLNENDPSSPQSVALSGYGVAPMKHVYVHYDYMVLPDQGTACTPRNAHPGDVFSPDCARLQGCIENVCRGHSHAPDQRAIDAIKEAFRQHGSELHIDPHHTAIPEHAEIEFGPRSVTCGNAVDPVNFYDLRDQYYRPGRKFEHYAIFGHYAQDTEEGDCLLRTGVAELPPLRTGLNFVVTVGGLLDLGFPSDAVVRFQAGTFMHELGHNLGLNHGGGLFDRGEFINYKPNFISVMNYRDQGGILQADAVGSEQIKSCSRDKDCGPAGLCLQGTPHNTCVRYDYSDQLLPTGGPTPGVLDERGQLSEPAGLGTGRPDLFFYSDANCIDHIAASDGPVDWDGDGDTTGTGLSVDLDFIWFGRLLCPTGVYVPLQGHNDWADLSALQERPLTPHGWKSNLETHREPELTLEEAKARHVLHTPRPVNVVAPSACSFSSAVATNSSVITLWLPGTDDLDVSQVDLDSLKLHGVALANGSVVDVNGDGRPDLELSFPAAALKLKLKPNAKRLRLSGSMKNSQAFWAQVEVGCQ